MSAKKYMRASAMKKQGFKRGKTPLGKAFVGSFSKKNLEGGAAIWYYYLDKRRPLRAFFGYFLFTQKKVPPPLSMKCLQLISNYFGRNYHEICHSIGKSEN